MDARPVRFGVIGIHGFSRAHIGSILALADADPGVRLGAAAAYQRELDPAYAARLEAQGVRLVPGVEELLSLGPQSLDVITVPTGIGLHVPFSVQGLRRGFAVLVEKPVAGTVQEVDELRAARDGAGRPVLVGFQYMYMDYVRRLKQALLEGRIGRVREVRGLVCWPRPASYYRRNSWAGRLQQEGRWVLDSPIQNACAHYLLLCLYFADDGSPGVAEPSRVRAELYRANPIESADTVSLEVETATGVRVLFLTTHASSERIDPLIGIIGDTGQASFELAGATVTTAGGTERWPCESAPMNPFRAMVEVLRGSTAAAQCSLEMARPQTVAVNAAHLSSPVRPVPERFISREPAANPQDVQCCISGIVPAFREAFERGVSASALGTLDWARMGEWVDARGVDRFPGPL